jgi:hypothetical protein
MNEMHALLSRAMRREARGSVRRVKLAAGQTLWPKSLGREAFMAAVVREVEQDMRFVALVEFAVGGSGSGSGGRRALVQFVSHRPIASATLRTWLHCMHAWLCVLAEQPAPARCVGLPLVVFVYLTRLRKRLPERAGAIIGEENVNTAFTRACPAAGGSGGSGGSAAAEIVVFREEEWFKCFLHETMHSYGLDFSAASAAEERRCDAWMARWLTSVRQQAGSHAVGLNLSETYAEIWARLWNAAFGAWVTDRAHSARGFEAALARRIAVEAAFSVEQVTRLLRHFAPTPPNGSSTGAYAALVGTGAGAGTGTSERVAPVIVESTAATAYFVLVAVLLQDAPGFMRWCRAHNRAGSLMAFNFPAEIMPFAEYVRARAQSPEVLAAFARVERKKLNGVSMRMTSVDLF